MRFFTNFHSKCPISINCVSTYTTTDHIKRVILALQVWCHVNRWKCQFNPSNRVESSTSLTFQTSLHISSSSLTTGRERRNQWLSPSLRLILVPDPFRGQSFLADSKPDLVKILADVVPRLEVVESWTDDDLTVVLHDAVRDLGVSQRVFMTVLRHALSGMKV